MPFTIFIRPKVQPRNIITPGPFNSQETRPNPGPRPEYPAGSYVVYEPPTLDIYSDDPAARAVLLSDPAGTATGIEIFTAFPEIRAPKEAEIRAGGAKRLAALATPYTPEERETWMQQQREAEAWLLSPMNADTPMLTALAAGRGITMDELVEKVMANVELFRAAAGAILGRQQALLDRLKAAQDYEELETITW